MSRVSTRVGTWNLEWDSLPRGSEGQAYLEIGTGKKIEVHWIRDGQGLWVSMPDGIFGFDLRREVDDDGRVRFHLINRRAFAEWIGVSVTRTGEEHLTGSGTAQKKGVRIKAQMPGKILKVLCKPGALIQKDEPLFVMEAMKMENEIRAPQTGSLTEIHVTEGQAIETGASLCVIESK